MKKFTFILASLIICLLSFSISNAQITWQKTFGLPSVDSYRSVILAPSGGYIACGYTSSFSANDTDVAITRYNIYGDTLWHKRYPLLKRQLGYKINPVNDGGYIVGGWSQPSSAVQVECYYFKIDSSGNVLWSKTFGGTLTDKIQDIIQTADGGFAFCGYSNSSPALYYDGILVKTDSAGNVQWSKYLNSGSGTGYEELNSLKQLPDGGFIMGGQTLSTGLGNGDLWIVRTNASGDTLWTKTYGTTGEDRAESVVIANGGYVFTGNNHPVSSDDAYWIKTDTSGNLLWQKTLGNTAINMDDDTHGVIATTDGGYAIVGTTRSFGFPNPNIWLIKLNSSGDTLWTRTFGTNNHDHGYSIAQAADGGYVLAGHSIVTPDTLQFAILKVDSFGNFASPKDAGITVLTAPVTNSCANPNQHVSLTIKNFGSSTLTSIPLKVLITGPTNHTIIDTLISSLAAGASTTYQIAPTFSPVGGTYQFKCFTSITGDITPVNDTMTSVIVYNSLPAVSSSGLLSVYNVVNPPATLTGSPAGGTFSGTGISGNQFNPATAGVGGPDTITYSYTDGNSCTNTATQQTSVVNCKLPAKPGSITASGGVTKVCPGESRTYTIAPLSGISTYIWTTPAGATITSGQGTVSVTVNFDSGFITDSIKVVAFGSCGTGPYRALKITLNVKPGTPGAITGPAYGVCLSSGVAYSVANVAGVTYNWSFANPHGLVVSGQGSNAITANFESGFVSSSLIVTGSNGCGISAERKLTVKPTFAAPTSITGSTSVCANQSGVPYSISPVSGITNYTWYAPVGSHISDGVVLSSSYSLITTSPSVTVNFGSTAGDVKVKANNSCGSGAYKIVNISMPCRTPGLNETMNDHVTIYPNPANDMIFVLFNAAGENVKITLHDMLGNLMFEKNVESVAGENTADLDLSNLSKGIYFIRVQSGLFNNIQKLIRY